jgi:hypothetical protein
MMIRATCLLALLLAPRLASAESVAVLELRFTSVPTALRNQIRTQIRSTLEQDGHKVTRQTEARRALKQAAVPPGCTLGPCLARVGGTLKVDRAVVGGVSGEGTSYDITLTMLETGGGTVLAQVSQRCDVCNFKEVESAATTAARRLHKQTLVFLSTRATLKVLSRPSDADVLLDGLPAGKTPINRILTPGPHTVEVATKDHAAVTQRVHLVAGKTSTVSVTLLPRAVRPGATVTRRPRAAPDSPRWIKWVLLGSGVVVGGVGGGLLAIDGRETSDPRYVHDTRTAGATMVSLGAAVAVAATLMSLVEHLSKKPSPAPALSDAR